MDMTLSLLYGANYACFIFAYYKAMDNALSGNTFHTMGYISLLLFTLLYEAFYTR